MTKGKVAARKAPGRGGSAGPENAAPADDAPAVTRLIALNLSEVGALVRHYELPALSALSPLTAFLREEAAESPRPIEEVLDKVNLVPVPLMRWALSPLAAPDRIIEARLALYNGAPFPMRLYSSRRVEGIFAGIRPGQDQDYEFLAPYASADLQTWLRFQMQFAGGQQIPAPREELSAEELAFLLALTDAHKACVFRSYATRVEDPAPITVTMADILEAQNLALSQPDRRWLVRALSEMLGAMVHPGGSADVRLSLVTEAIARRELKRYAEEGMLQGYVEGRNPTFSLGSVLGMTCGSLMSWVCILSLHDIQVSDFRKGQPVAGEEMVLFVITEATVWTILSEGLAKAGKDLGAVRFGLRSMSPIYARQVAASFLQPLEGLSPPDAVYAAVEVPARGGGQIAPAPPAASAQPPSRTPKAAAPWAATHLVPAGGLDTWEKPDAKAKPSDELEEGIQVQVVERLGDWARVVCDNGWTGWIDGRDLVEV